MSASRSTPPEVSGDPSLRGVGIELCECDASGVVRSMPPRSEHWLSDLCCHCPMLSAAIRKAAPTWGASLHPAPEELLPGVWIAPRPKPFGGLADGYTLAVVLTREILGSEHLLAMCQSAALDAALVKNGLTGLSLFSGAELPRIVPLIARMQSERDSGADAIGAIETMGKELAASYEEVNLLYSTIESMSVIEDPRRFTAIACEELLNTLSYRWIGAMFDEDHPWLKSLAGRFIIAGDPGRPVAELRQLTLPLLERIALGEPIIIEPDLNPDDQEFAELGAAVLVQPVSRNRHVIGALVAADKQGADPGASSVDLKLLGATATHLAIFLENASLYDDLSATFLGTLEALTAAIDAKDPYTCGHSLRVAQLTRQLAVAAGIDGPTADRMRIAGLVHDVGKIGVPESVLTKPGRLTREEFGAIQKHPEIGHRILRDIPQLRDILPGVLHHHERWDGQGYPTGLAGPVIPRIARVIALADSFDAMSSTRTYRPSMSRDHVLGEIRDEAGRQFDAQLAAIFVTLDFQEFDDLVALHSASSVGGPEAA